jgi:hypothetical protein
LMELMSSCIFLSQVLSCLANSSSVFSLITISSLSSDILSSAYSSLLAWPMLPWSSCPSFWVSLHGFTQGRIFKKWIVGVKAYIHFPIITAYQIPTASCVIPSSLPTNLMLPNPAPLHPLGWSSPPVGIYQGAVMRQSVVMWEMC